MPEMPSPTCRPPLVLWGVLAAAVWQSAGLWTDLDSPYLVGGLPALVLWSCPVALWWLGPGPRLWNRRPGQILVWLALLCLLGGILADLNVLRHGALAFSLAALWSWRRERLLWLAGAALWLPAGGWAACRMINFPPNVLMGLRVAVAILLALFGAWSVAREKGWRT
ncbi:MAG: hypothetical protein WC708_11845 [Lentisphaeria bacterium]